MEKEMGNEGTRVLIVGANSYVGKHLAEYLREQPDYVVDMVRASNGEWKEKSFRGYDCIVLSAALVHRREKQEDKELYHRVNCRMPIEIAKKARQEQVGQMVFMSTMAVYGDGIEVIGRNTVPKPSTFYGESKLKAEEGIMALEDESFRAAIIRAPMVYGKNCPGNYARLQKAARYLRIFPDIENRRSMVEIGTLVRRLEDLIANRARGFFYPQDAEYGNTSNMVRAMRERMGKKTSLVKWFNFVLIPLCKRVGVLGKLFGDCWYEKGNE